MRNILLYIQEDQVDPVLDAGDIGCGQTSFAGMAKVGNRVFVASKSSGELSVVGEIPIAEAYEDDNHPYGWKFRVRALEGQSIRYSTPVKLRDVMEKLSILRGKGDVWGQIRNARWLTDEDASLLNSLGGQGSPPSSSEK